jgi:hypothetical protein
MIGKNVYNYDVEYFVTLDYNSSGFGIMLLNQDAGAADKNEYYLFRIGNREFSLEYNIESLHKTIKKTSINTFPPAKDMTFALSKKDKVITVSVGSYAYSYIVPNDFANYKIAIYSNKGNVVKYVSANTSVPSEWMVNNTEANNGNIVFDKDQFSLVECNDKVSVSQDSILLSPGVYYLKYEESEGSDITAEITTEDGILTGAENGFSVRGTENIGISFSGTNGTIKKVQLTNYALDKYMRTHSNEVNIDGSKISFDLGNTSYLEATFTAYSFYSNSYYMVHDGAKEYSCIDLNMQLNESYTFKFYNNIKMLYVYNAAGTLVKDVQLSSATKTLSMFYNTSGAMTDLTIKMNGGEIYSPIVFRTKRNSVPGAIISPVVVVDQNDNPFELSASYRIDNGKYKFTNVEREYFEPANKITLAKTPLNSSGTIKVYGVKEKLEPDFIKMLTNVGGADCINAFTLNYETLYENDMLYVDKEKKELYISDISQYEMIIVDYLKKDSYCINYDYDTKSYMIDVSTMKDEYYTMYDYVNSYDGEKSIQSMNRYKLTDISPANNQYITIRRSELA